MSEAKFSVEFEGVNNIKECMDQLTVQYQRTVMQRIYTKAASKFLTDAKRRFKGSLKKTIGMVHSKGEGYPTSWAGLVYKGNSKSKSEAKTDYYWIFQRAFWFNVGTLANRSKTYDFATARVQRSRPKKKGKGMTKIRAANLWKGGIKPADAISQAWTANQAAAQKVIETESAKIANKFIQSKANKR